MVARSFPAPTVTDGIAKDRIEKMHALRQAGVDPFPPRVPRGVPVAEVLADFDCRLGQTVTLAGRLTQIRDFGKLRFCHLQDRSGSIQIGFQKERLPAFWPDRKRIEANDLVAIRGELGKTQKGEPTLWATEVVLAAKSLRHAPEKWHGLVDMEQRYRQRYVDLFANPEVQQAFVLRSRLVQQVRAYFDGLGYHEVETPILQPILGVLRRGRSRPTTTRSTCRSTSGSRRSSISSGSWSAASSASTSSAACSATRASAPGTTPSSRCSRATRRGPTTTTSWCASRGCSRTSAARCCTAAWR
jgi:lysyl-tRNA synthetase class II